MLVKVRNIVIAAWMGALITGCAQTDRSHASYSRNSNARMKIAESPRPTATPDPGRLQMVSGPVPEATQQPEFVPSYTSPTVTIEEIRDHLRNRTALIIDARSAEQFAEGHVEGAINVPADEMELYTEKHLRKLDPNQLLIIYCSSSLCHSSDMLYEYLQSQGFTNMRVFAPGWLVLGSTKSVRLAQR